MFTYIFPMLNLFSSFLLLLFFILRLRLSSFALRPCSLISIDVMDVSGEQQLDVEHNLYKRRLSKDGEVVEEEKQEELGHPGDAGVEVSTADPDLCESCYGAESGERKCCNTCAEVQSAYQAKGWAFTDGEGIAQCEREGWTNKIKEQEEEGCNMYGKRGSLSVSLRLSSFLSLIYPILALSHPLVVWCI